MPILVKNDLGSSMSRLAELASLLKIAEQAWNDDVKIVPLCDLVLDMLKNKPLPVDSKQYGAERYRALNAAHFLLADRVYYLHEAGKLRDIYQLVGDPVSLERGVAFAFFDFRDENTDSICHLSLDLGGLAPSEYFDPASYFSSEQLMTLSPYAQKKILTNELESNWARPADTLKSYNYMRSICNLIGVVAESDAALAIRILLDNYKQVHELSPWNMNNASGRRNADSTAGLDLMLAVSESLISGKFFHALGSINPQLYQEVLLNKQFLNDISDKFCTNSDYGLRHFSAHPSFNEEFLSDLFVRAVQEGAISKDKALDIQECWAKNGGKVSFESIMVKHPSVMSCAKRFKVILKRVIADMKGAGFHKEVYEDEFNAGMFYTHDLCAPAGEKLCDQPELLNALNVLTVEFKGKLSRDDLAGMQPTAELLDSIIRELHRYSPANSPHDRYDAIRNKAKDIIIDLPKHDFISRLRRNQLDILLKHVPELDMEQVRKVDWKDPMIKANLLDDALGL